MTHNNIYNEVEVDTNVLKIKSEFNKIKKRCGELQNQETAVRCYDTVKKAENEVEDIVRGESPKDRIQQIHREREEAHSINDLVDKEMY